MPSSTQPVTFPSGPTTLHGKLIRPEAPSQRAVLISGATGVPHTYYHKFAIWLAEEHGCVVLIYDYRDYGASATTHMRHASARMSDWGITDGEAARAWLMAECPDLPLWVIGHSLGAMMIRFQQDLDRIDRLIAIASGPVHVSDHPWPYQALARMFWFGHGPIFARLFGYLPGRYTGLGADLPRGVFEQWRSWCISRDFGASDIGTELPALTEVPFAGPMKHVTLADDVMIPANQAPKMRAIYPRAEYAHLNITPQEYGLSKIGHLGAFSSKNRAIWPQIIA